MKRAATGAMTLVGLVLVICAAMGAVLLGPHGTWHSELRVPAGHSAVVIGPSLAAVIGPQVCVQASSADPDAVIFAGRARPDDAAALVATVDRLDVDGLDGARRLDTSAHPGSESIPPPAGLDVWRTSSTGVGSVDLDYRATAGAETIVLTRADGGVLPALTLRLGWSDRAWLLVPVLLFALGLALLLLARRWGRTATAGRALSASARRRRQLAATGRRTRPQATGSSPSKHVGKRRAAPGPGRRR